MADLLADLTGGEYDVVSPLSYCNAHMVCTAPVRVLFWAWKSCCFLRHALLIYFLIFEIVWVGAVVLGPADTGLGVVQAARCKCWQAVHLHSSC